MTANSGEGRIERTLSRLRQLHPRLIDLSLGRIERLLAQLDHPERRLPPVVHIAGTNGKGSTLAMMRAGLAAAGQRVHAYTSPHLVRFNERIVLAGQPIDDDRVVALLERVERRNGGASITEFEIATAAALLAFAETPADILLLETGLGGRVDATNVIARPVLTAISSIALDHQHFLGDSLAKIAVEKAGIMKRGVPCVLAPQPPEALAALHQAAARLGAPVASHGEDWSIRDDGGALVYSDRQGQEILPRPRLLGPHQVENAGLAVACLRHLAGFGIDRAALASALTEAEWPARMQRLAVGPLLVGLPEGSELWLDGGHNPAAGEALAATLGCLPGDGEMPLHLVLAMLGSKCAAGFLRALAPLAPQVWTVPFVAGHDAFTAEELAAIARAEGLAAHACADVAEAIATIAGQPGAPPRVLIAGSLYMAGEILKQNG